MVGRLKSPFDQFNNVSVSWDRLNHLSIILILEIKTNHNVYSVNDRQWLLMPSISIVNLRGERNTAILLELIDFKLGVKRICFVIIVKSLRRY